MAETRRDAARFTRARSATGGRAQPNENGGPLAFLSKCYAAILWAITYILDVYRASG
jgi:hypothetical protein